MAGELERRAARTWLLGAAGILAALVVWHLLVVSDTVSERDLPKPTTVATSTWDLFGEAEFRSNLWDTIEVWAVGLGLAAAVAIPLGVIIGWSRLLYRTTIGVIDFLRPIPSVGLLPVAILLFGLGFAMKLGLLWYALTWPILLNTIYGVHDTDPVMISVARSMRWSKATLLRRVILPSAAPYVATGLRVAAAIGLVVTVSAELLASSSGIGTLIRLYQQAGRTEFVYAGILVAGMLGVLINISFTAVERRLLHWSPSYRGR